MVDKHNPASGLVKEDKGNETTARQYNEAQ
jgi:hypothetical protein